MKRPGGQTTKPVDFHFCTEARIKQNVESQPGNEYKEVDFAAILRKHPPSPVRTRVLPALSSCSLCNAWTNTHREVTTGVAGVVQT